MNNLKLVLIFSLFLTGALLTSCDNETPEPERFQSELVGDQEMEILIDTETDLVWVNDTRGCFAAIINPTTECSDLMFAGQSDWRTPTPDEMANLLTEIGNRNMSLNYINTQCGLMSTSDSVWIFTENTMTPGERTMNMPGNAGLRCVRDNN